MLKVACFNAFSSFFFVCIQYVIVRFAPYGALLYWHTGYRNENVPTWRFSRTGRRCFRKRKIICFLHSTKSRTGLPSEVSGLRKRLFLRSSRFTWIIWSSCTPCSNKWLWNILNNRNDLPHRRIPVMIFIIPFPSADISSCRYDNRLKYIVYGIFL